MKYMCAALLLLGVVIAMTINFARYINGSSVVDQKLVLAADCLMFAGFIGLLLST